MEIIMSSITRDMAVSVVFAMPKGEFFETTPQEAEAARVCLGVEALNVDKVLFIRKRRLNGAMVSVSAPDKCDDCGCRSTSSVAVVCMSATGYIGQVMSSCITCASGRKVWNYEEFCTEAEELGFPVHF